MVLHTRHNGYPIAEKNERNWHEEYQEALSLIDADIAGVSGSSVAKDEISAAQSMHLPVYADLSNYSDPIDGDIAYASGDGVISEGVYAFDGVSWIGPFGSGDGDGGETNTLWTDLDDVEVGTLDNRPAAGTSGQWYFTTDQNDAYYDNGDSWIKSYLSPGNIDESDLTFDPVTNTELTSHTDTTSAHHTRYSDTEAQSAVAKSVDAGNLDGGSGAPGQVLFTDGTESFWDDGDTGGAPVQTGTFTHTSDSMSTTVEITDITTDEQAQFTVSIGPNSTDQVSTSYAFNYDYSQRWDNTNGWTSIDLVVNWDSNPGSDMVFEYSVLA